MVRRVHAWRMRTKQFRVTLTPAARVDLQRLISSGKTAARTLVHARILLQADTPTGEQGAFDLDIAAAVETSVPTVERVRRRFVEEGLAAALVARPATAPHSTNLDGRGEARLVAEACSPPPGGQGRWTLRLLTDRLVELGIAESISYETVRRTLKKTSSSPN